MGKVALLSLLSWAGLLADDYRPAIHFSPARNWTNDPCGMYFLDGRYHLFFQYNPFGDRWGRMSWGHASSNDLFHWIEHPVALPEENGVMMFTGSGVFDRGNRSGLCKDPAGCPILMYTGHIGKPERREHQNLAVGDRAGVQWTKYAGNPVIDEKMAEFRDPKVFWHEGTRRWIAVISLAKERRVRFYASNDLKAWVRVSEFGPAGAVGPNWECPDFFELPVLGRNGRRRGDSRWILKIGIGAGHPAGNGSGEQYFVGRFDGKTFINDNPADLTLWFDSGPDCYCTLQWGNQPAGGTSTKMLGWMNNWRYASKIPTSPFRGQMTLPRDVSLRELADGSLRLVQEPAAEMATMRRGEADADRLPPAFEVDLRGVTKNLRVRLTNARGQEFVFGHGAGAWYADRTRAGDHGFDKSFGLRAEAGGPVTDRVRLVVDTLSVEAFAGAASLTSLTFPDEPWRRMAVEGAAAFTLQRLGAEVGFDGSGAVNAVRVGDVAVYSEGKSPARALLLTSARRDAHAAGRGGVTAYVPLAERSYFSEPRKFWDLFWETRFHDYEARQNRWPVEPLPAKELVGVADGETHEGFTVMATPGFTRGAVTYLREIGGEKHAFTGDLIYEGGRIWDLYSLQDSIPDVVTSTRVAGRNTVRGYHGFAARASDLMASLRKLRDAKPAVIVPARGPVIRNPEAAISRLLEKLDALMREHFSTDALRWYWGDDNLRARAAKMSIAPASLNWMEMAETRKLPEWVIPIQNSKLIVSKSGGALLVDCGYERVYQEVEKLRAAGRFTKLEGIYVTHYHDDHTDFVAEASKRSGAPVMFVEGLRDVLRNPAAYRLPAMTTNPIEGEALKEGARRDWHEYSMEFAFFPGQTLYHGVMVLTHRDTGMRIVFGGDSFTPSGIDDYCLLNRNLVGENEGYLYCLRYLRKLGPDVYLTNQHVDPMWTFRPEHYARMESSLRKREAILKDLFPFDSPNYGVDEQWARFYPYGVEAKPGETVELSVRLTNHSPAAREFTVRVQAFGRELPAKRVKIGSSQDGSAAVRVSVPRDRRPGAVELITASVESPGMRFGRFAEAMVRLRDQK